MLRYFVSHNITDSTATGYVLDCRSSSPGKVRTYLYSPRRPDQLWDSPSLTSNGFMGRHFLGGKAAGEWSYQLVSWSRIWVYIAKIDLGIVRTTFLQLSKQCFLLLKLQYSYHMPCPHLTLIDVKCWCKQTSSLAALAISVQFLSRQT
jgi:hypothetical protein